MGLHDFSMNTNAKRAQTESFYLNYIVGEMKLATVLILHFFQYNIFVRYEIFVFHANNELSYPHKILINRPAHILSVRLAVLYIQQLFRRNASYRIKSNCQIVMKGCHKAKTLLCDSPSLFVNVSCLLLIYVAFRCNIS